MVHSGFVPKVQHDQSTGDMMFVESGHMAAAETFADMLTGEGADENVTISNMQDCHNMLAAVLNRLVGIQRKGGFLWDL